MCESQQQGKSLEKLSAWMLANQCVCGSSLTELPGPLIDVLHRQRHVDEALFLLPCCHLVRRQANTLPDGLLRTTTLTATLTARRP